MWAKIITIKRTKDLNYSSLCALNLFNKWVLQFELNYWNKLTFPWHSNLLRCTCIYISAVKVNNVNNALTQIPFNGTHFINVRLTQRVFSVWPVAQPIVGEMEMHSVTNLATVQQTPLATFFP